MRRSRTLNVLRSTLVLGAMATLAAAGPGFAGTDPGTGFTYQGRLTTDGVPFTGAADVRFTLFTAASGGSAGASRRIDDVPVTEGLFDVEVDFGAAALDATRQWAQIEVRVPAGSGSFVPLDTRQKLTSAPFAAQVRGLFVDEGLRVGVGTTSPQARLNVAGWAVVGDDRPLQNPHGFSSVLNVQAPTGGPNNAALVLSDASGRAWSIGLTTGGALDLFKAGSGSNRVILPVLQIRGGADIAEPFDVADDAALEPGMLVAIDPGNPGALRLASRAYDRTVAGVVSGAGGVKTGLTLTQEDSIADGTHPVALTGRVYCYVDADANGPVRPGDLLTTSDRPGHAMRATDLARRPGAVIGKAMTSLESGTGLVLILVSLQ